MLAAPVLRAQDLALRRGSRLVHADLSLDLGVGVTAILGRNGIGKTTLLEALADPSSIDGGVIALHGGAITDDRSLRAYFAATGFLPQQWSAYRGFTVRESVSYVAWLKGLGRAAAEHAVGAVLDALDLEPLAGRRVHRLSGGMQQRVGIAEAFVNDPAVVFLDEPTVGLDPEQRAVVRDYLRSEARSRAVVVSTHLTDDVEAIADRVIVLDAGGAVFDGAPAELAACAEGGPSAAGVEAGYLAVVRRRGETR